MLPRTEANWSSDRDGYECRQNACTTDSESHQSAFFSLYEIALPETEKNGMMNSEAARRETLIAPILLEACDYTDTLLNIEYPIAVNNYLRDTVNYFIAAQQNLLVIEAKQADLSRGFTQLSAELLALDQWTVSNASVLYGAVTTGDIWKFGSLHRSEKRIVQDLNLYRVPADLEELLRILIGILLSPVKLDA